MAMQFMHRKFLAILVAGGACVFGGCGQNIWNVTAHPMAVPEEIKIYTQTPARYERLGTVTHLGLLDAHWAERPDARPVFSDLLKEAAAMGANGLLLVDDTTTADSKVTVKYQGTAYDLPIHRETMTVLAQAVFVKEK